MIDDELPHFTGFRPRNDGQWNFDEGFGFAVIEVELDGIGNDAHHRSNPKAGVGGKGFKQSNNQHLFCRQTDFFLGLAQRRHHRGGVLGVAPSARKSHFPTVAAQVGGPLGQQQVGDALLEKQWNQHRRLHVITAGWVVAGIPRLQHLRRLPRKLDADRVTL